MNEKTTQHNHGEGWHHGWWNCCGCDGNRSVSLFGIFLVLIGGFFLAREFGWIAADFPFWPLVALGFGIYFIAKSLRK